MIAKPKIKVKLTDSFYDLIAVTQLMMNISPPKNNLKFVGSDDCWEWSGFLNLYGYGIVNHKGKDILTHRLSYELIGGNSLTPGLVLDHLCRNTTCINPKHLEEVTIAENTLRGNSPAAQNARKKECDYGHEFTEDNIIWEKGNRRRCKKCIKQRHEKEVLPC